MSRRYSWSEIRHQRSHVARKKYQPLCPFCRQEATGVKEEKVYVRQPMPWEDPALYPLEDTAELVARQKNASGSPRRNHLSGSDVSADQKQLSTNFSDETLEILTAPGEVGDDSPDLEFAAACRRAAVRVGPLPHTKRTGYPDLQAAVDSLCTNKSTLGVDREFSGDELVDQGYENKESHSKGTVRGFGILSKASEACQYGQHITYGPSERYMRTGRPD